MEAHQAEVRNIANSVKGFYERGQTFRINHGSTNSTRKGALGRHPSGTVDTSRLNGVVSIDTDQMIAFVEPNVPMDRLIEATLEYRLIPPVVMEFPGITVGGGYAGTSGESSSWRHGFFDRTLISVEMVLADGEIVKCDGQHHADLFHGAAGALGTLGVVTMVEIRLRKAKRFVETTYVLVTSVKEAIDKTKSFTGPDSVYDYVDGVLFSRNKGAIVVGRLVDEPPKGVNVQRFSGTTDPWFYLHVQNIIQNNSKPVTEAIPLPEYLFRYDRGGFWVGRASFNYFPGIPFNKLTRWFLDDFLHTRMLYKALHASGQSERMIIQDLALPYCESEEFIDFAHHRLGIWPLWLCPLKQSPRPTMHPHLNEYEDDGVTFKPMLNIGLWGDAAKIPGGFVQANTDIESKLRDLRGMKWLYAQTFCSEYEFWQDFDKEAYDELRKKYRAESLPSVYEKVRRKDDRGTAEQSWSDWAMSVWPLPGIVGIVRAIQSGDYLLARDAKWKEWVPRA